MNPNSVLDQGLIPGSNKISSSSHRAQNTQVIVETSKDISVRVDAPEESRCEFTHATLCNNTAQVDLGINPATELGSSAAEKVVGSSLVVPGMVNASTHDSADSALDFIPIYDINHAGVEEKFANSIIHFKQFSDQSTIHNTDSDTFRKWSGQSDFQFGFIPLGEQKMPETLACNNVNNRSLIEVHHIVRKTGKPNFLGARIPVMSPLKVEVWQDLLKDYWDQQPLQLLRFGFPLDFNRNCPLKMQLAILLQPLSFLVMLMHILRKKVSMGPCWDLLKKIPLPTLTFRHL